PGAGRGSGRGASAALAGSGYTIVAASGTEGELEATARLVRGAGGAIETVTADVGTEEGVVRIFERARELNRPIRLLVNIAGTLERKEIERLATADLDRTLAVNTRGAVLCALFAYRTMLRSGGGCIVNIASLSAGAGVEEVHCLLHCVASTCGSA